MKNVSPGEFISGGGDDFRPELDAYLVWMVDWAHELHVGRSIWEVSKIKPHLIDVNVGK
ncbi:conserved hypothetical protein [Wolbachia endosymbiont of Drosophila ananassae]|nr:conserved hypothetical protein [Wolbachia endosymbiont of Drosophila ananassae]